MKTLPPALKSSCLISLIFLCACHERRAALTPPPGAAATRVARFAEADAIVFPAPTAPEVIDLNSLPDGVYRLVSLRSNVLNPGLKLRTAFSHELLTPGSLDSLDRVAASAEWGAADTSGVGYHTLVSLSLPARLDIARARHQFRDVYYYWHQIFSRDGGDFTCRATGPGTTNRGIPFFWVFDAGRRLGIGSYELSPGLHTWYSRSLGRAVEKDGAVILYVDMTQGEFVTRVQAAYRP